MDVDIFPRRDRMGYVASESMSPFADEAKVRLNHGPALDDILLADRNSDSGKIDYD
jgi:hypothetical protein